MAGILKKIPSCTVHGQPCFIKTGTKDGPMKGKTFFICGNQQDQCSFAVPASGISATFCSHHNTMNDLRALCKKGDGIRCYYRCTEGRKMKVGWCGYEIIQHGTGKGLNDVTNKVVAEHKEQGNEKSTETSSQKSTVLKSSTMIDKKNTEKSQVARLGKENNENSLTSSMQGSGSIDFFKPRDCSRPKLGLQERQDIVNTATYDVDGGINEDERQRSDFEQEKYAIKATESYPVTSTVAKNREVAKKSIDVVIVDDDNDYDGDEHHGSKVDDPLSKIGVDHDSTDVYQQLLWQEESIEREIKNKKTLLKTVNVQLLLDKGKRLNDKINQLELKLSSIKIQKKEVLSAYPDAGCLNAPKAVAPEDKENRGTKLLEDPPLFAGSALFNKERLYEGRMTKTKLQQVGRVTRDAIEELHRSLETCPSATTECEDPIGLLVTLMPHQRQALAWLLWREKQVPSGGILADDMGLGKTLTSIALILKDKEIGFQKKASIPHDMKGSAGTLVICPASLVHHWKKEIDKRVKPLNLTVFLYHGQMRDKNADRLSRYDVVLTTYSIVALEAKDLVDTETSKKKDCGWLNTKDAPCLSERKRKRDSPICQLHWRRIILDEAHNIKNPKCMTSVAACFLEAESRWALTGTPIQNNTKDLYAIIKFLRCCPFDEFKVWKKWVDDKSARGTERMNTLVRSLLLRRTKQQHLTCLPSRDSVTHKVTLDATEKEVYELIQLYSKNMLRKFLDNRCKERSFRTGSVDTCNKIAEQNGSHLVLGKQAEELLDMFGLLNSNVNAGAILLMVLRLRQCCSHLSLLREVPEEEDIKEDGIEVPLEQQMMNMSIADVDQPKNDDWSPAEFKRSFVSSKLRNLLEELQKLKSLSSCGKQVKSVVVSQWTKMLDIIARHLRINGFKYDFITGSVTLKKRSEIVEDFNTNPNGVQVMLVSLRAGGVGLNLIGGSHLFLVDQHWNPALESQACDRIYRVGQQNDVVIHRFLCTDTVEERIAALQEKKKALADTVLKGGKSSGNNLTLQDLRVLFGV